MQSILFDDGNKIPPVVLRPYQEAAIRAVHAARDRGLERVSIVMPTGCGKTTVFSRLAGDWHDAKIKTLVLAHRSELLNQGAARIRKQNPSMSVGIESGTLTAPNWCHVVVAGVQSIGRETTERLAWFRPGCMVVDECHHSCADSYQHVMRRVGAYEGRCFTVGVTATPHRMDNRPLHGDENAIYQECVYQYTLRQAIDELFLCDLRGYRVATGVDLSGIKTTAGDYNQGALQKAVNTDSRNDAALKHWQEVAADRRTIAFCAGVEHAKSVAATFVEAGVKAESVDGSMRTEVRDGIMNRFRTGETQVLTNVDIATEGFDVPEVGCVLMLRPTQSWALFCLDGRTEVLTKRGWMQWDTIRPDDLIASYYADGGRIVWETATGYVARPLYDDEYMLAYQSPCLDFRVTDGHRMLWRNRKKKGDFAFTLASDLANKLSDYEVPVSGEQSAQGLPLTDDEIRFIGWFLSDGCRNKATNGINISQFSHQPQIKDLEACLRGCGFKYSVYDSSSKGFDTENDRIVFHISMGKPRGKDKHLRGWGDLKDYIDKDLSPAMEDITSDQLAILLEAFHLGNGAKQLGQSWTRRSYHLSTGNKVFADKLQSLCVRRGFRCNLASLTNTNGNPIYILHVKRGTARTLGGAGQTDRPTIQNSSLTSDDIAWCVTVPSTAIVTRRNGKVLVTGNTQMVGRGLRVHPGKPDCIIIDVVDNTTKHSIASVPALLGLPPGLNLKGNSLKEAAEKVDAMPEEKRAMLFKRQCSFDDLNTDLTEIDLLSELSMPDEIVGVATMPWLKIGDGYYMLTLGSDGHAHLKCDPLGTWWATVEPHDSGPVGIAVGDELKEAFKRAEHFVTMMFPNASKFANNARWRVDSPTEKQIHLMLKLGIEQSIVDAVNRGQASQLITARLNKKGRK